MDERHEQEHEEIRALLSDRPQYAEVRRLAVLLFTAYMISCMTLMVVFLVKLFGV